MLFKDFKTQSLLPEDEIVLNKAFKLNGRDALLASLTYNDNKAVLWLLYHIPRLEDEFENPPVFSTKRDQLLHGIKSAGKYPGLFINNITIQGQKINISSSGGQRLSYNDQRSIMLMQHFLESGVDTSIFDNIDISDILINFYELREAPQISTPFDDDILLCFSGENRQIYIGNTYTLEFDKDMSDERFSFYDTESQCEKYFYINKLMHYDIWEQMNTIDLDNRYKEIQKTQNLSDEQIAAMKAEYLKSMEYICPKEHFLSIIEYETEDDIQLQFYDKDYLDSVHKCENSNGACAVLMNDNDSKSLHGFKVRTCVLKPIPNNFKKQIDVELFSWFMHIPDDNIVISKKGLYEAEICCKINIEN